MTPHGSIRMVVAALATGALILGPALALAQSYPNKPIKLVLGYPPGGGLTELLVRWSTHWLNTLASQ